MSGSLELMTPTPFEQIPWRSIKGIKPKRRDRSLVFAYSCLSISSNSSDGGDRYGMEQIHSRHEAGMLFVANGSSNVMFTSTIAVAVLIRTATPMRQYDALSEMPPSSRCSWGSMTDSRVPKERCLVLLALLIATTCSFVLS
jgi:hypothetical protein